MADETEVRFNPRAENGEVIAFNKPLIVVDDATPEGMESAEAFEGAEARISIQVLDLSPSGRRGRGRGRGRSRRNPRRRATARQVAGRGRTRIVERRRTRGANINRRRRPQ